MQSEALLQKEAVNSAELEVLLEARKKKEAEFVLVDVREPFEYEEGHLPGVDLLRPTSTFGDWAAELIEMSRRKPVILTCRTGNRTGQVQRILLQNGAEKLIDHRGGIMAWRGEVVRD